MTRRQPRLEGRRGQDARPAWGSPGGVEIESTSAVYGLFVTENFRGMPLPSTRPVRAYDDVLPRDGWIKFDQPATTPRLLLGPKGGRLNPDTLDRVDVALRFDLAI